MKTLPELDRAFAVLLKNAKKKPRAYKAPKRQPSSKTKLKAIAAKQKRGRGKK